jgi:hypothetical protein
MAEGAQVRCVGQTAQIESLNLHGFYPDSLEGSNFPLFHPGGLPDLQDAYFGWGTIRG